MLAAFSKKSLSHQNFIHQNSEATNVMEKNLIFLFKTQASHWADSALQWKTYIFYHPYCFNSMKKNE